MEPRPNPRVGVAAVITNADGSFIMGKRKGSHGSGQWAFPGGHLEYGESFFACAERETLEETGLRVQAVQVAAITNDVFTALNKHYITVFVFCQRKDASDQPKVLEPDKCEDWVWKTWDAVRSLNAGHPDLLFLPIINLMNGNHKVEDLFKQ